MRLYFSIPIFTRSDGALSERFNAYLNWFGEGTKLTENIKIIQEMYKPSNINHQPLLPGSVLRIHLDGIKEVQITYPDKALVPKGLAVRLHMLTILDSIDNVGPAQRDDTFFIMIDGSGAFEYSNVHLVIKKLLQFDGNRYDVVMGSRPSGNSGMDAWRKNVELFEEYLMVKRFEDRIKQSTGFSKLPDSQAGCWGLRLSSLKHLPLTAKNYELEYDLLASAIENSLKVGFTEPLTMHSNRTTSDFASGDLIGSNAMNACLSKMKFIAHKLDYLSDQIPIMLTEYLREIKNDTNLKPPDQYIKAIESFPKNLGV